MSSDNGLHIGSLGRVSPPSYRPPIADLCSVEAGRSAHDVQEFEEAMTSIRPSSTFSGSLLMKSRLALE